MADDTDFSTSGEPSLQMLATFLADELFDVKRVKRVETAIKNAAAEGATVAKAAEHQAAAFTAELLGKFLALVEEQVEPVMAPFLAKIASHLVGVELPTSELRKSAAGGGEGAVGEAMSRIAFNLLAPPAGEIQPGREGAEKFIKTMSQLVFNGWFEGTAFEMLATLFPDMDSFESVAELPHNLVNSLGLSRLARTALRPLAHLLIATPLDWQLSKTHRPKLLSEGEIVKALARGDYSEGDAGEELARIGYSERRIDMLRKSATKRLSTADALQLARHGLRGRDVAIQDLRDEGYDQATAELLVVAEETKRFDAVNDNSLSSLVHAYVNREITDAMFSNFLTAIIPDEAERGGYEVTARTQREMNVRHLSSSEVIDCVELGILPTAYYRDWLRREGYPEDEAFALELRLRSKIDKDTAIETQRERLQAERADEKRQRAEAAAQRKADVEAERALHRRGSLGDLNRAAVRGLISFSRVVEVLSAEYDADTVSIMVALLEEDRQAYLDAQRRADEAKQRAGRRSIDVGAIEQAVLAGVLTLDEYGQRLAQLGFDGADAAVLVATLDARKQDIDAARAKRAEAEGKAKVRQIDLGRAEQLVRRGAHSLSEYSTLLAGLGYDEGSRAAMVELLQLQMNDDAAAAAARRDAESKLNAKGVSLETFRRAVILGSATEDAFQRFLVEQKFTSDAQALLMAELRNDVTEAAAARRRREEAAAGVGARALPLDRVRTAARLGLVAPAVYFDRLARDKYTADDISIEKLLLVQEMADVAAARQKAAAADQAGAARGLSLSDVARAVKAGAATVEDYRGRAVELGYSAPDADTLVAVLQDELAMMADTRDRRTTISGELADRTLSLGQLEAAVKAGALSLDAYQAQLESWGYGSDDASLLAFLLMNSMAAAGTGGNGG